MKNKQITSKLVVMIISIMLISCFIFVGCDIDDVETTTTTTTTTAQTKVEYTGPIKNVSEMAEYAGKTVYDTLVKNLYTLTNTFVSNAENVTFKLKASEDNQSVTEIAVLMVNAPKNDTDKYDVVASVVDCNINYKDILMNTFTRNTSDIKNRLIQEIPHPTKEKYAKQLPLSNAIATKFGIDLTNAKYNCLYGISKGKDFESTEEVLLPDGTKGAPPFAKYQLVAVRTFTPDEFVSIEVSIKDTTTRDPAKLLEEFNAGNYVDLQVMKAPFSNTDIWYKDFGSIVIDSNSTNKDYPTA